MKKSEKLTQDQLTQRMLGFIMGYQAALNRFAPQNSWGGPTMEAQATLNGDLIRDSLRYDRKKKGGEVSLYQAFNGIRNDAAPYAVYRSTSVGNFYEFDYERWLGSARKAKEPPTLKIAR